MNAYQFIKKAYCRKGLGEDLRPLRIYLDIADAPENCWFLLKEVNPNFLTMTLSDWRVATLGKDTQMIVTNVTYQMKLSGFRTVLHLMRKRLR